MNNKYEKIVGGVTNHPIGDDLIQALRGFDANFLLIANIPVGEFILAIRRLQDEVARLNDVLNDIGDKAHDASTGPTIPDALWEIRSMAYEAPGAIDQAINQRAILPQPMAEEAMIVVLVEALQDMMAGWKYIRSSHGDLYGVGWDRAQDKAEAALVSATAFLSGAVMGTPHD